MKNLLIVTKLIKTIPPEFFEAALAVSTEAALVANGVYNHSDDFTKAGFKNPIRALAEDCTARNVASGVPVLTAEELIDAIETNDKVITI